MAVRKDWIGWRLVATIKRRARAETMARNSAKISGTTAFQGCKWGCMSNKT